MKDAQHLRELDDALEQLRQILRRTVRAEQLVDQLTKLGNDDALNDWIQSKIDAGEPFWLAFIEVDHFKSVNDEFGYDAADELLRRIAAQLTHSAADFFTGDTTAFRAHGDEFFLCGDGGEHEVHAGLEQLRAMIAALQVRAGDKSANKRMRCTVSIGWATHSDAWISADDLITQRRVRGIVEKAVAEAKRDRNKIVRYTKSMEKSETRDGRADCRSCLAKFTVVIPIETQRLELLYCPNCGERVARPPSLRRST